MEVKVVVVVVTVTVTVVTVTVTVVTISFWRGPAHPACSRPPPIKVKSKVTHFGGGVFHFSPFSTFRRFRTSSCPNRTAGTTSTVHGKFQSFFGRAFSTFSPFSDRTDSAAPLQRKISVSNAPFSWRLPHPLLPTVVRKLFTQLFGRFPTFTFSRTTIFFRKSEF